MEIWRREKGSTILLAILVLAVGSALVISLAQTKQNSISSAIAQERSTRALDLAESGLETVCQQARAHIMDGKDLSNFSTEQLTDQFGGGEFTVKTQLLSSNRLQITSRGRFEDITRVVREEVEVKPPTNSFNDSYGAASGGETSLYKGSPGSYYAEKKLTAWVHNELKSDITLASPKEIQTNLDPNNPRVTIDHNPPPPDPVSVDFDILRSNAGISYSGNTTVTDVPEGWFNSGVIFVDGDLTIYHSFNFSGGRQSLTLVATGTITISMPVTFSRDDVKFNVISGKNTIFHQSIDAQGYAAEAFFYSGGEMKFNGHHSLNGEKFSCRMRSQGDLVINGEAHYQVTSMTINIPGVTIGGEGGSNGGNGPNQGVFAVVSWQEIDPTEF